jgi:flagellar hook-length control protein FliK
MTSAVSLQASQTKADANKADPASPFALLVASTAPAKTDKPARKDAQKSDDKHDDKTVAKQDDKAAPAAPQVKTAQTGKLQKSDKDDDKTAVKADGTASADASAVDPQAVAPQTPPPVPAPATAPQAAMTPASDDGDDIQLTAVVPTGSATPTGPAAPAKAPATQAAQANPAVPQDEDSQGEVTSAEVPAEQATAQIGADAKLAAKSDAQSDVKGATAKTDAAKAMKTAANGETSSADNAKAADAKSGDARTNPPQPQANTNVDASVPKPAPQPVQAANNNPSAAGIAAPQTQQPAAAPVVTQTVQVTAQPAPNIPALAVEVAAKSQSGAKQFDIRLDPPELGRVDVRLSIDAAGKASAHLTADQPQTLDLLQKDSTSLTRALRDAGLNVSQDGLNFSLRQQASGQDGGNTGNNGLRGTTRAFSATATTSIEASAAYRAPADGRLDIRV